MRPTSRTLEYVACSIGGSSRSIRGLARSMGGVSRALRGVARVLDGSARAVWGLDRLRWPINCVFMGVMIHFALIFRCILTVVALVLN